MKEMMKKRESILGICIFLYVAVSAFFMVKSYGVYSIDEFYSLGSADLDFETAYNRTVYMNFLVRLFSKLFGQSFYVFKMIPEIMGGISFGCALYLMTKLCKKNSTILVGSVAITFNALILFNHIYIRHYVCQEMIYMIGMVLVYLYTESKSKFRIGFLLINLVVSLIYHNNTGDESGYAMVAIAAVMCIMALICKVLPKILGSKIIWSVAFLGWGIVEVFVILLKKQMIDYTSNGTLKWIHYVLSFYQTDMFTFVLFLILVDLSVVIALLAILFKLAKNKFEDEQPLFLLVYTCLPIIAYFSFFFNNNLLRTFNPYITAGIVIFAIFYDGLKGKIKGFLAMLVVVNLTFSYYPFPTGLVDFWSEPGVGEEIYTRNYNNIIDEAREAEQEGYEIVPMLTLTHQEHYFGLNPEISLTILDDNNKTIREDEEIVKILEELIASGEKYVLTADTLGRDVLVRIGWFEKLQDEYRHSLYDDSYSKAGLCVFYIE